MSSVEGKARINQEGIANEAEIFGDIAHRGIYSINQIGEANTVNINQHDFVEGNEAQIDQFGDNNEAQIVQFAVDWNITGNNEGSIVQRGNDNSALINQTAAEDIATINQEGNSNSATVIQGN